jgi:hypothetical protein
MASNSMEGITGASLLLWFLSQLFIWFYYFQQYYNWKVIRSTICRPYFQTLSACSSLIRVVHWFWRPIDSALCSSSWWPLPIHQTQTSPFWVQAGRVELVPLTSRMAYFISVSRKTRLSPDFPPGRFYHGASSSCNSYMPSHAHYPLTEHRSALNLDLILFIMVPHVCHEIRFNR